MYICAYVHMYTCIYLHSQMNRAYFTELLIIAGVIHDSGVVDNTEDAVDAGNSKKYIVGSKPEDDKPIFIRRATIVVVTSKKNGHLTSGEGTPGPGTAFSHPGLHSFGTWPSPGGCRLLGWKHEVMILSQ